MHYNNQLDMGGNKEEWSDWTHTEQASATHLHCECTVGSPEQVFLATVAVCTSTVLATAEESR